MISLHRLNAVRGLKGWEVSQTIVILKKVIHEKRGVSASVLPFIPGGNYGTGFGELGEASWEGDWLPEPPPRHLERRTPNSCQYLSPNVCVMAGVVGRRENKEQGSMNRLVMSPIIGSQVLLQPLLQPLLVCCFTPKPH